MEQSQHLVRWPPKDYHTCSESKIVTDHKGISYFQMTRIQLVRVVQHSRILLRGWRANSDIKLLLYYSDPSCLDISEIEDGC
jgi:hypothetical protein